MAVQHAFSVFVSGIRINKTLSAYTRCISLQNCILHVFDEYMIAKASNNFFCRFEQWPHDCTRKLLPLNSRWSMITFHRNNSWEFVIESGEKPNLNIPIHSNQRAYQNETSFAVKRECFDSAASSGCKFIPVQNNTLEVTRLIFPSLDCWPSVDSIYSIITLSHEYPPSHVVR